MTTVQSLLDYHENLFRHHVREIFERIGQGLKKDKIIAGTASEVIKALEITSLNTLMTRDGVLKTTNTITGKHDNLKPHFASFAS